MQRGHVRRRFGLGTAASPRKDEWTVTARKPVQWSTGLVDGLLALSPKTAPDLFGDVRAFPRRFVAVDEHVWPHYGEKMLDLLSRYRIEHNDPLIMPGGEEAKTQDNVVRLLAAMDDFGVPRFGAPPQGWGGGVLHDLMALAGGQYRRGVEIDFVATTLLCAIDAMFALKCASDYGYKNRIGLYTPVGQSWTDLTFYGTLADVDIREGMAEIIKWALAGDPYLFRVLELHGERISREKFQGGDPITREVITRTIRGMLGELALNPFEQQSGGGVRRRSYIGHGISPAWEPQIPHGQAVIFDILLTTMVAWRLGQITPSQRNRIVQVVASVGLRLWDPVLEDTDKIMLALRDTAMHRGGQQLMPTPQGVALGRFSRRIGTRLKFLEFSEMQIIAARDDLYKLVAPTL
jgi:3-dehydroquinate synthetase